jgi:hypothetical protein
MQTHTGPIFTSANNWNKIKYISPLGSSNHQMAHASLIFSADSGQHRVIWYYEGGNTDTE